MPNGCQLIHAVTSLNIEHGCTKSVLVGHILLCLRLRLGVWCFTLSLTCWIAESLHTLIINDNQLAHYITIVANLLDLKTGLELA